MAIEVCGSVFNLDSLYLNESTPVFVGLNPQPCKVLTILYQQTHKNAGKGPRYSPSSSAALNADAASLHDAKGAVVQAMALLEVSLFLRTSVSWTTMFHYICESLFLL